MLICNMLLECFLTFLIQNFAKFHFISFELFHFPHCIGMKWEQIVIIMFMPDCCDLHARLWWCSCQTVVMFMSDCGDVHARLWWCSCQTVVMIMPDCGDDNARLVMFMPECYGNKSLQSCSCLTCLFWKCHIVQKNFLFVSSYFLQLKCHYF